MFDKFVPDMHVQSIFRINYKELKKKGIKLIIFDLDNTIEPVNIDIPRKEVIDLIDEVKDMGFTVILMSNSKKPRVSIFKNALNIDACASARKPFKKKYLKILSVYNVKSEEVCAVGDQLITDIYGANNVGITSILVNPISKNELFVTKFNRFGEKILMIFLSKNEIFKKGEYYD